MVEGGLEDNARAWAIYPSKDGILGWKWERYCTSLVSTFERAIKNLEVKVDVQKGVLRCRGKIDFR